MRSIKARWPIEQQRILAVPEQCPHDVDRMDCESLAYAAVCERGREANGYSLIWRL